MSPAYSSLVFEENHFSPKLEEVISTRYLTTNCVATEQSPQVVKVSGHLTVSF